MSETATPAALSVTCTAVEPSTCSDHEGAVDASVTIVVDGETFDGEVTLLPGYDGRLGTWGSGLDHWAGDTTVRAIRAWEDLDRDRSEIIEAIVGAVTPTIL